MAQSPYCTANIPAQLYDAPIMGTIVKSLESYQTTEVLFCAICPGALNIDDDDFDFKLNGFCCRPCRDFPAFCNE